MKAPWPFGHLGLKAVSVGLAMVLWLAVAGEETVERGLRVPLELQQLPPGLEVQGEPISLVDVRVRGTSGALAELTPGDLVAVVDLRGARPGRRVFPLTPDQVRAPFGVEVVQVTPASVAFEFEGAATRRVPVVPAIEGSPAPGFVVGEATADPADVEITGPASAVHGVKEALTEPVSVAGARDEVIEQVSVGVANSALRVKSARPVTVHVRIAPGPRERTFREQPVYLRGLGQSLTARAVPSVALVQIRGSQEGVARLSSSDVVAFVDLSGLGPGEYSLPVRADAPPAAGVMNIDPSNVQVVVAHARE